MKFALKLRNTHATSSGIKKQESDKDIRIRIAQLPSPIEDHNVNQGASSPRRARTVPARRIGSPNTVSALIPERTNPRIPQSWEHTPRLYPKRSRSLMFGSEEIYPSNREQDTEGSSSSQQSERFYTIATTTTPSSELKTPKKSSPAFSISRNSIKEPFLLFKNKFRRKPIEDVFPVTPEKQTKGDDERDEESEEVDVKTSHRYDRSVPDLGYHSVTPRNPYDSTRDVYHTARLPPPSIYSHTRSGENSDESDQTFYDAHERMTIASIKQVSIVPAIPPRLRSRVSKVSIDAYPARDPSVRKQDIVSAINKRLSTASLHDAPPLPLRSASRLNINSSTQLNKIKVPIVTAPTIDDIVEAYGWDIAGTESSPEKSLLESRSMADMVRSGLSCEDTAQCSTIVESVTLHTEGVHFKHAKKNYFPVWAAEIKSNGRPRYTQQQIIDIVSASL